MIKHPFKVGDAVDIIGTSEPCTIVGFWCDSEGEVYGIVDLLIYGTLSEGKQVSRIVVPIDGLRWD